MTRSECINFYNSKLDPIFNRLENGYDLKRSLYPYNIANGITYGKSATLATKESGFIYKGSLFINKSGKNTKVVITFMNPYYEEFNYSA